MDNFRKMHYKIVYISSFSALIHTVLASIIFIIPAISKQQVIHNILLLTINFLNLNVLLVEKMKLLDVISAKEMQASMNVRNVNL